jgi:hypothetical protein
MLRAIVLAAALLILLTLGVVCLFFPERVQRWAKSSYAKSRASRFDPFRSWVESEWYPGFLQIGGILALVGFVVVVLALVFGKPAR